MVTKAVVKETSWDGQNVAMVAVELSCCLNRAFSGNRMLTYVVKEPKG